jgi:hypothetical protein
MDHLVEWEWAGETEVLGKTWLSATLSTTNFTWLELGSNPDRRDEKPTAVWLSYDKAIFWRYSFRIFAGTQTLFTGFFCDFPQFLQENAELTFRFGQDCSFLSNAFHFFILKSFYNSIKFDLNTDCIEKYVNAYVSSVSVPLRRQCTKKFCL